MRAANAPFFPTGPEFDHLGNIVRLPQPGATIHDVYLGLAMLGMLVHGDTQDRSPVYIATRARVIADEMVRGRRVA